MNTDRCAPLQPTIPHPPARDAHAQERWAHRLLDLLYQPGRERGCCRRRAQVYAWCVSHASFLGYGITSPKRLSPALPPSVFVWPLARPPPAFPSSLHSCEQASSSWICPITSRVSCIVPACTPGGRRLLGRSTPNSRHMKRTYSRSTKHNEPVARCLNHTGRHPLRRPQASILSGG